MKDKQVIFVHSEEPDYKFIENLKDILQKAYPNKTFIVFDRPIHSMSSNNLTRTLEKIVKELKQV